MTTVDSFQQTVASGWIVIIDGVILSIIDGWKGRGERSMLARLMIDSLALPR